jgi:hypothetical protein
MGKRVFLCAVFVLAACAPTPPPALTGVWRAKPPDTRVLTIEHRDPEVKVRSGIESLTYTTDSSETCNVIDGEMVCSRGRWDGPFLQIDSTVKADQGEITSSERWSLSRDGKTLTIHKRGPKSDSMLYLEREQSRP